MVQAYGMAIPDCTEKLKSKPALLDVLQERTSAMKRQYQLVLRYSVDQPYTIVDRAVNVLAHKIAITARFNSTMIA